MKNKKNMIVSLALASMLTVGQAAYAISLDDAGAAIDKGKQVAVQAGQSAREFFDIASHWGKGYIENLMGRKAINGYPDGTFRPYKRYEQK